MSDDIRQFASEEILNTDPPIVVPVTTDVLPEQNLPSTKIETTESGGIKTTVTVPATTPSGVASVTISTENITQISLENPLHEYASYTYNISLHMISIETYNRIINNNFVNNSPTPYVPENVLISSAGRYNDVDFKRNKYFKEDFYFEDFRMQTVITPNMRNRNTNMIECSFTIIEPNGFTLINRMIAAANEINKGFIGAPESYVRIPYVLQIDFFGYKEKGDVKPEKIKDLTKIIPICLVNVETQVRQAGAEYKVQAVAFNHQVFSQVFNAIPFNTQISAKTVSAAFNANTLSYDAALSGTFLHNLNRQDEIQREISKLEQIKNQINSGALDLLTTEDLTDTDKKLSTLVTTLNGLRNLSIDVSSVCSAINQFYETLKKRGEISYVTKFHVEFDLEIGNSEIFYGMPVSAPGAATTNSSLTGITSSALQSGTINIPAGSTITNIIDFIVRNSRYIQDQIELPDQQASAVRNDIARGTKRVEDLVSLLNKPLKWYKIVPTLKVGKWDNKLKRFAADTVILYVKKFTVNSKYPFAPTGRVPGYVKKYDYMFTGRNKDIIDWHINFNTLYLLAVTGNLNKTIQGTMAPGLNPAGVKADPDNSNIPPSITASTGSAVASAGITYTSGSIDSIIISGSNPQKSQASSDLLKSLLLDARGDMVELELKILGDPHFIKQDDVFYNRPKVGESFALTPNKSLYMDTGELYIFVNFLSPVDYSEEKGLAEIKANEILNSDSLAAKSIGYSNFSGVYKLITVDSVLSRGKFEQTLRMAKILTDQTGASINAARIEQINQLSLTINNVTGSNRINSQDSTSAAAIIDGDSDFSGRIINAVSGAATEIVGRVTKEIIDKGIAAIRNSSGSVSEGISISDQPESVIYAGVTPEIINIGFSDTTDALG